MERPRPLRDDGAVADAEVEDAAQLLLADVLGEPAEHRRPRPRLPVELCARARPGARARDCRAMPPPVTWARRLRASRRARAPRRGRAAWGRAGRRRRSRRPRAARRTSVKPLAWTPADGKPMHHVAGLDARAVDRGGRGRRARRRCRRSRAPRRGRCRAARPSRRRSARSPPARHTSAAPSTSSATCSELDAVGGDVVEQEERLGAGRGDVVDAVGGQVAAAVAQAAPLAREDQLRSDRVGGGREQAPLVERVQAGERAEARAPVDSTAARSLSTMASAAASETPAASYVLPSTEGRSLVGQSARLTGRAGRGAGWPDLDSPAVLAHAATWTLAPLQLAPVALVASRTSGARAPCAGAAHPFRAGGTCSSGSPSACCSPRSSRRSTSYGEDDLFALHMVQHVLLGDLAPLAFVAWR